MLKTIHRSLGVLLAAALALVAGCDRGPEGAGPAAPTPAHPAMTGPAAGSAAGPAMPLNHPPVGGPGAAEPSAPMPPDHPPIDTAPADEPPAAAAGGPVVVVGPLTLTAPPTWPRQSVAASPFAPLAAFTLPRADGDPEDGRLTVSQAAGGVDANIARWQGQFKENPPAQKEAREVAGMKVTVVRLAGTLSGGRGPMAAGADKPNSKLWGAVIEQPGGQLLFLKATGPAKTLDRWDGSFGEFLGAIRKSQ
jgi:hypothetical protein